MNPTDVDCELRLLRERIHLLQHAQRPMSLNVTWFALMAAAAFLTGVAGWLLHAWVM